MPYAPEMASLARCVIPEMRYDLDALSNSNTTGKKKSVAPPVLTNTGGDSMKPSPRLNVSDRRALQIDRHPTFRTPATSLKRESDPDENTTQRTVRAAGWEAWRQRSDPQQAKFVREWTSSWMAACLAYTRGIKENNDRHPSCDRRAPGSGLLSFPLGKGAP